MCNTNFIFVSIDFQVSIYFIIELIFWLAVCCLLLYIYRYMCLYVLFLLLFIFLFVYICWFLSFKYFKCLEQRDNAATTIATVPRPTNFRAICKQRRYFLVACNGCGRCVYFAFVCFFWYNLYWKFLSRQEAHTFIYAQTCSSSLTNNNNNNNNSMLKFFFRFFSLLKCLKWVN